MKLRLKIQ